MVRVLLGTEDLGDGEARIVRYPTGKPPKRSFIVVGTAEGLRVYWNVCRHLPIPLDAGIGKLSGGEHLVCLTHGARYRPIDGHCVAGPCKGEILEAVEFEVVDGEVFALLP